LLSSRLLSLLFRRSPFEGEKRDFCFVFFQTCFFLVLTSWMDSDDLRHSHHSGGEAQDDCEDGDEVRASFSPLESDHAPPPRSPACLDASVAASVEEAVRAVVPHVVKGVIHSQLARHSQSNLIRPLESNLVASSSASDLRGHGSLSGEMRD